MQNHLLTKPSNSPSTFQTLETEVYSEFFDYLGQFGL